MQFTDHSNILPDDIAGLPNFEQVESLRAEFGRRYAESGPLDPVEQLDAALSVVEGVDAALILLWAASRQYARWLDNSILPNDITDRRRRLDIMLDWRKTLQAYKMSNGSPQDPAGDTYYMWTHVLAQYSWRVLSTCHPLVNRAASSIFLRGTDLMHGVIHRLNTQSVPNSHRVAANYGNELGEAIVRYCLSTAHNFQ